MIEDGVSGGRAEAALGLVGDVVKMAGATVREMARHSVPEELKPFIPEAQEKKQNNPPDIIDRVVQVARPVRTERPPGLPRRLDRLKVQPRINAISSQIATETKDFKHYPLWGAPPARPEIATPRKMR